MPSHDCLAEEQEDEAEDQARAGAQRADREARR